VVSTLTDNTAFEEEYAILQSECEIVMELMRKMVQENTRTTQDQAEYQQRYSAMVERFNKANGRLSEVEKMIEGRNAKRLEIERVIKLLKKQENLLTEFDEGLWQAIVHQLKIHSATEFTFILKDGTELPWRTGR
jgi:hypothetical protein